MNTLKTYIEHLSPLLDNTAIADNPQISGITCDSRKVGENFIFVAIKGSCIDGHEYINAAITAGAAAIVHTAPVTRHHPKISYLQVNDSYLSYAMACECFFDFPAKQLCLHGVTGTNGKTTTAYLLEKIMLACGVKCGLISTVEYRCGDFALPASRTTPDAYELQQLFSKFLSLGCTDLVMETSSHGLDQRRTGSAKFSTATFTNLSGDHLDYHFDMENYFRAKQKLFTACLDPEGTAIVNADDPYGARLCNAVDNAQIIDYGADSNRSCQISDVTASADGSRFNLTLHRERHAINSPLIGEFNIYNMAAAFAAATAAGCSPDAAAATLNSHIQVPGRLEHFHDQRGVNYFVDYAHTDDALRNVLTALRQLAPQRIITVFGCGGNRDRTKRPRMGRVAAELSDLIIITDDNPRFEDSTVIIEQIKNGFPADFPTLTEPDRAAAIRLAAQRALPGDIVLVAGKGHETYQERNGKTSHFDDREIIKNICSKSNNSRM